MSWHIFSNVRIDQFAKSDLCPSNPHRGQEVHDEEIYKRQVPPKTVFWITPSCVSCFGAIDGTQDDQSHIRWGKIEILWRERWSTILHSRSSISGQWEPQHIASFVFVHRELLFILHPRSIVFVRKTFIQIDAACSSGLTIIQGSDRRNNWSPPSSSSSSVSSSSSLPLCLCQKSIHRNCSKPSLSSSS